MMDWRVVVIDENRFRIVGTFDLTFDECKQLDKKRGPGFVRIPHRRLASIAELHTDVGDASYSMQHVRGESFHRHRKDSVESMLHVVVADDAELDGLRRTGRFREWDADLKA